VPRRLDEPRMGAWRALLAAHATLLRRLDRDLEAEHGISMAWYEVLLRLQRAPEGHLPMSELAGSVFLTPSGLTRLVDRMEHAGLVERAACPSDRRVSWAVITGEGRALLRRASVTHLRGIQRHFGRLLDGQWDAEVPTQLAQASAQLQGSGC